MLWCYGVFTLRNLNRHLPTDYPVIEEIVEGFLGRHNDPRLSEPAQEGQDGNHSTMAGFATAHR